MRNFLKFILRYHFFILFIILETISVYIVIQKNSFQKAKFVNFARSVSDNYYKKIDILKEYLYLRKINRELVLENVYLRNKLKSSYKTKEIDLIELNDSIHNIQYHYIAARVINNSVNKQFNYLTLNKGEIHGIHPEMAVICDNGIVGIVQSVTKNFCSVISVLNRDLAINAKFRKNNYFGPLSWDGKNNKEVILTDIPHHVQININDTIVTSGYSHIFPEGIIIGYITDYKLKGGNFYKITVKLSANFSNLLNVYIITNKMKEEQLNLENISVND